MEEAARIWAQWKVIETVVGFVLVLLLVGAYVYVERRSK